MIHIFNKPLGLGNMYENRKMYGGDNEYPANPIGPILKDQDPCFGKNPTAHANKCLVLTNSFGNGCLEPMDVSDPNLPGVMYCEDTNIVFYSGIPEREVELIDEPSIPSESDYVPQT